MKIFTFSPFGYEGALVNVEVDLRRGIPAVDVVGMSDGAVKEARERVKAAIRNSGFEFPSERVLVSLSPADLKKEGAMLDLSIAAGILVAENERDHINESVIVLGELELSGKVRPCKAIHAAVSTAYSAGIRHAIVPKQNLDEALAIKGMKAIGVRNLREAEEALRDISCFEKPIHIEETDSKSGFFANEEIKEDLVLPKRLARAIDIAVAGKHHLLVVGKPGCGKTLAIQNLVPALAPKLTVEESQSVTRIHSIAGLLSPDESLVRTPPFRRPHQTASLEGMCGGGVNCRPGEVSLSHNGFLFLDETAEFRSAVLQMLRVPLETGMITLSRAGRSTTFPARFQMMMATNPCPCGNLGSKEKTCLCSEKSVVQYWQKFGNPLIDRIGIFCKVEENEHSEKVNICELREHIKNAFVIQRKKGGYNNHLSPHELFERFRADKESEKSLDSYIEENSVSERRAANIKKIALTIANMENRETVSQTEICEAISYSNSFLLEF